ncbi:hypothetical protein [Streptomyces sp. LaBMicrA B280]|uniref:hypothetical protein n=1 Tax=Streptomyces sp. LaBMicrA B280 TaxID=3391001 RepID=UPI003BA571EE
MFNQDMLAVFTTGDRDELIRDFMTEYGVSEPTATMVTSLFLTIASTMPEDQAEAEFQQAVTQSVAQGESWATELVQAAFDKRLPGFRATYQRAISASQDPAVELARRHNLPAAAAAEVIALLTNGPSPTAAQPTGQRTRREAPAGQPYLADITCPSGLIKVTVDPTATVPSVTVRTDDKTGPSADAVRDSTISLDGDQLTIRVPDTESATGVPQTVTSRDGRTTVYQSVGTVHGSVTGVRIVNGDMYVGDFNGSVPSSPIEVLVTLPAGSGVKASTHNAHLNVTGPLAALRMDTHNGHVTAGVVGRVKVTGHNGNYTFDAIQESVDIDSHNGHTKIDSYSGHGARVISHNGTLDLAATPQATGRIEVRSHNGSTTLRGVRGRQDLDIRTRTHNGSVRTV